MANMKYFSGETALTVVYTVPNADFERAFPGVKGKRDDSFSKWVGRADKTSTIVLPVERVVQYKSNPSKHVCDSRCYNATGRIMKCECSCGGKNHGRGAFNCEEQK